MYNCNGNVHPADDLVSHCTSMTMNPPRVAKALLHLPATTGLSGPRGRGSSSKTARWRRQPAETPLEKGSSESKSP